MSKSIEGKLKLAKIDLATSRRKAKKKQHPLWYGSKMIYIFVSVIILLLYIQISSEPNSQENLLDLFNPQGEKWDKQFTKKLPIDLEIVDQAYFVSISKQYPQSMIFSIDKQKSRAKEFPLEVKNSLGIKFRLIPKGNFLMGSPKNELGRGDEQQHLVSIKKDFYISKFEITQKQWTEIMVYNQSSQLGKNFPIVDVNYVEVKEFVKQLNIYLGVPPNTYSLLTEEQWEYACRSGSQTAYYFVDDRNIRYFAWYVNNSGRLVSLKEEKTNTLPNAWGVYNMAGSVAEFTKTHFRPYNFVDYQFHPIWDIILKNGKKNAVLKFRQFGINKNIFVYDVNNNGLFDFRDFIWQGTEKFSKDSQVIVDTNKNRDYTKFYEKKGIKANVLYRDDNKNGFYDEGEFLWKYSKFLRENNPKIIFRGGSWINKAIDCRSALRWNIQQGTDTAYLGVRLKRNLYGFK